MPETEYNAEYLLDSDEEPPRLERMGQLYGVEDDLRHLSPSPDDRVLDVGCGSGFVTRAVARHVPRGSAIGVDRDPRYIDFAQRKASAEGIENIRFAVGNALSLPFEDRTFDVVWSKHMLQWVMKREFAIRELVRVTRPGGRVIACNFDYLMRGLYPVDPEFQTDLERWCEAAYREVGFDSLLGRKLPHMFMEAGLKDIKVDFIPDKVFGGFGGDPDRRWNWEVQYQRVIGFSAKVFGSMERAAQFTERLVEQFNRPDVYLFCPLFYVEGRVP